ncbi:MAG: hypothetical protein J5958_04160 [Clostridia bacterium]|nr:hypothetical protein [Clostridia bacterium]MBR5044206.1 hypothetical protein [Clostridia bacterium]
MKKIDRSTLTIIRFAIPLCLSFLIVVGVVFTAVFHPSLGWFSAGKGILTTGMQVVTSTDDCDILIERTTEYDKTKGAPPIERYAGVGALKTYFTSDGFDATTETTTANAPRLAFELVNELEREEFDEYVGGQIATRYLLPGAYGTLTFYLRPFPGVDRVVRTFTLSLMGLYAVEDNGNYTIHEVTSESTLDLLTGHILFFTERTGATHEEYKYDGFVPGSFVYDSAEHELCEEVGKTDCYKITLYWEWPETYLDISRKMSTAEITRKYPMALDSYITANARCFFAINQASVDETERSEGYDDGDQKIGSQVDYISVLIEMGN